MIESNQKLSFDQMSILKQKILSLMHSLLEKQKDEASLKKMKKDLDTEILRKVITEIYYNFALKCKKIFKPSQLRINVIFYHNYLVTRIRLR